MLSGLSLSNRQWLAEHLVEPEELKIAQQRKRDEELVRKLHELHYEGEMSAEEMKKSLRDSHHFGLRDIKYTYDDDVIVKSQSFTNNCLYSIYSEEIEINTIWIDYLTENYVILRDFAFWKCLWRTQNSYL